jgi:thiol:disulfide interchange protein
MKRWMLFAGLFLGFALAGQAQVKESATAPTQRHAAFDPKRDAAKDLQDALVLAKKTEKNILIDVGGEWCPWCRALDSLFVRNHDLDEFLFSHYVVLKINYSKENKNEAALSHYPKIPGYPHLFVLNASGELVKSQDTGELENPTDTTAANATKGSVAGHDKSKVLAFLKKYATK